MASVQRAAHAAVAVALDKARLHTAQDEEARKRKEPLNEAAQTPAWTKHKVIACARREAHRLAAACHSHHKRLGTVKLFHKTWIKSGLARMTKKGVKMTVFDERPRVDPAPEVGICIATDGSGMRDGRAGWAYTAREDVRRRVGPQCAEECGPVILAQDDAEYIGAQKATNNTAANNGASINIIKNLQYHKT